MPPGRFLEMVYFAGAGIGIILFSLSSLAFEARLWALAERVAQKTRSHPAVVIAVMGLSSYLLWPLALISLMAFGIYATLTRDGK